MQTFEPSDFFIQRLFVVITLVVISCANPLTSAANSLMLSTIGAMRPRGLRERVPSGVRAVGEVVDTRLGKICSTS